MMKIAWLIRLLPAAAMIANAVTPALAVDQKNSAPPIIGPTKIGPSKLTSAECEGLGGTVIHQIGGKANCDSGYVCSTTDKNGVIHRVRITKQ